MWKEMGEIGDASTGVMNKIAILETKLITQGDEIAIDPNKARRKLLDVTEAFNAAHKAFLSMVGDYDSGKFNRAR